MNEDSSTNDVIMVVPVHGGMHVTVNGQFHIVDLTAGQLLNMSVKFAQTALEMLKVENDKMADGRRRDILFEGKHNNKNRKQVREVSRI